MPNIQLCFLWHMHQPLYKDLVNGTYRLPWARLHALKDYYGMVKLLEDFPTIHQTFNLVPSLLVQIEDYAEGRAVDPFLNLALKPAERLTPPEKEFVLRYFFQANEENVIRRYPRYAELFQKIREQEYNPERAAAHFDVQMLRDLQVLSQLAWFDEEYLRSDPDIRKLAQKGRHFELHEQALLGPKQQQAMRNALAVYKEFADRGQIELSVSALYHPILPLICDSNICQVAHPYTPAPSLFAYPADAEEQLRRARGHMEDRFGRSPAGLWPSEGSVSDQTLAIAARVGFAWTATDDGVLSRTVGHPASVDDTYRPYLWSQRGSQIRVLFRDQHLSDLIGFVYSRVDPEEAAEHFVGSVIGNCAPLLEQGETPVVPIILDGENAWENYPENGRPFLRKLYERLAQESQIAVTTMSEALATAPAREISQIFPGSWIDANFDVWIGAEEDNAAWELLLKARKKYDEVLSSPQAGAISQADRATAWEELLIAEGSDWCWWYGPEHFSANRAEFDQLYRDHLSNVYRLLAQQVPPEFAKPILRDGQATFHDLPGGFIQPAIDGKLSSRHEWRDAGRYRMTFRSAVMHSRRPVVQELYYGTDGKNIFFRLDFSERSATAAPLLFQFTIRNAENASFSLSVGSNTLSFLEERPELPEGSVVAAVDEICEVQISMSALHIRPGDPIFLLVTLYRNGLPVGLVPPTGELQLRCSPMIAAAF
jgi:alpha-amylase/alpha-mannosidase (GH57 family)